jgi:predicted nucleic acid-binding protein
MTGPGPKLFLAEPTSSYARRPRLVVDASLIASVLFAEETDAESAGLLRGRALFAPTSLDYELANAGRTKVRRGTMSAEAALEALAKLERVTVERYPVPASKALALGLRYGLTAYDASYLWLAASIDAPLATLDTRLADVARRHLSSPPPSS